ncbi:hypothetical protein CHS0354_018330 [Potamilus streckersoni]|uniref:F-box domain-containing protein n=1 Tax=Potamilus streckersoni TaxID=2493646 RepID=A0AAE0VFH3_9BIVA|nr:hypothetical protein CHS0354_018330 [Potamilus streckersoni]
MDLEIEKFSLSTWTSLSEEILMKLFHYLPASSLLKVAQVCKTYNRMAFDESLWKDLFYRHWKINRMRPMCPRKVSWVQEYKRLYYHTPSVESEVLRSHTNEVLHVSFAHNGKMFATCSKDGFIKVWDKTRYPCSLKNEANMKRLKWDCTAYSEVNENDTLLLVSGLLSAIGPLQGEIVIFSL